MLIDIETLNLQFNLAGIEESALVVDGHPEVSALVVDGNVGGVTPVDNPVLINARHSSRVENSLVLPRAQRHQALHQNLQNMTRIYKFIQNVPFYSPAQVAVSRFAF